MFEKNAQNNKTDPGSIAEKIRHENQLKKQQKEAENELIKAQQNEIEKQKVLEEKAAEAMKQAKMNKLTEQMNKFGIMSPPKPT